MASALAPAAAFTALTGIRTTLEPQSYLSNEHRIRIARVVRNHFVKKNLLKFRQNSKGLCPLRSSTFDFEGLFLSGNDDDEDGNNARSGRSALSLLDGESEAPECPPGLRSYETMVILRPDITEEERIALTNRYEENLVTGGGMCVEAFNRGVMPLAYEISKRVMSGEKKTFIDGIYLLFTYFTKPESIKSFESQLKTDDDVIRMTTFKIVKKKKD